MTECPYQCKCDPIRQKCCEYNTKWNMVPWITMGETPADQYEWHEQHNCNEVMGGTSLTSCLITSPHECECDTIRTKCCSYNTKWGLVPYQTWGTTPENQKAWHTDYNCNEVMGGSSMTECPYECETPCYTFITAPSWCIDGHNLATFNEVSYATCEEYCRVDSRCASFDWRDASHGENCALSAVRTSDMDHGTDCIAQGWSYYERQDCDAKSPCFTTTPSWCIDGHNLATFNHVSYATCEENCNADPRCVSFDWRDASHGYNCGLSAVRTSDIDHGTGCIAEGWSYHERQDCDKTYTLMKTGVECQSDDSSLGTFSTVQECADATEQHGGRFFIFGINGKAGKCWSEHTSASCPEGWKSNDYNFYSNGASKNSCFTPTPTWCMDGHNLATFKFVSYATCEEKCNADSRCASFDWRDPSWGENCALSAVRTSEVDHGFRCVGYGWTYHERQDCDKTYTLLKTGAECRSSDSSLGTFSTVQECAHATQQHGGKFFIFGINGKAGKCWIEHTSAWCPEGWESDDYNFYANGASRRSRLLVDSNSKFQ